MATNSSILAWGNPWTKGSGRLQSMGSERVGYDLATKQQQNILIYFIKYTMYINIYVCNVYVYIHVYAMYINGLGL